MKDIFKCIVILTLLPLTGSNAQSIFKPIGVPTYDVGTIHLKSIDEYPAVIIRRSDSLELKRRYDLLPESSLGKRNRIIKAWFSSNQEDKKKATDEFINYWKNYSKRWTKENLYRNGQRVDGVSLRGVWRTLQLYDIVRSFGYLSDADIDEFRNTLVKTVECALGENPDSLIVPDKNDWRMSNIWADVALSAGTVAMAFPELPQADKWINFSVNELLWMIENGVWDGAWHECPRYHLYQMKITANFLVSLYNRTGINLFMHPSVQSMAKWFVEFSTPRDKVAGKSLGCEEGVVLSPGLGDSLWGENMGILNIFANYIRESNPILSEEIVWLWKRSGYSYSEEPVTDLLINPTLPYRSVNVKSAITFRKGYVSMRNNHDTDNEIWLLLKSGNVSLCGHENGDANSISIFAYGTPLLLDSGSGDYNDPNHRKWNKKSISHNVVVFREDGETDFDKYHDSKWIDGKIVKWKTNDEYDYTISDASEANDVELYRRHILFVKDGGYFVIWDEIESDKESSFMLHSPSDRIVWDKHAFSFVTPWQTQLDVYSLLPNRELVKNEHLGNIGEWTENRPIEKVRSFYKFKYQKFMEIRANKGEDYLTVLYPRKSDSNVMDIHFDEKQGIITISIDGRISRVRIIDNELVLI